MLKLRVVESSAFIAAPLAGLTLAQFGADVIRVDNIGGGFDYGRLPVAPSGRSLYWTGLNKGKRSIAVDLRRPEGREIVRNLVTAPGEEGGVLLTNVAMPWLTHDALAQIRSDLISCTIEGNPDGTTAVDYTVNCATGFPLMTGHVGNDEPVNHVLPAWDMACAYQAAFAIAVASDRRRRTGEGATMRMALADMAFSMLSHVGMVAEVELLNQERPKIGNHIYGAFGRDFVTADRKRVMVAGISEGQWKSLVKACEVGPAVAALEAKLQRNFSREAHRYEARDEIAAIFAPWFAARTLDEVDSAFSAARVCWGLYRTTGDLIRNDARVGVNNPIWERLETPGVGSHLSARSAVRVSGDERRPTSPAPMLGQHTDEILHDVLGLDSGGVARLHDAGIVAGPDRDPTLARAHAG